MSYTYKDLTTENINELESMGFEYAPFDKTWRYNGKVFAQFYSSLNPSVYLPFLYRDSNEINWHVEFRRPEPCNFEELKNRAKDALYTLRRLESQLRQNLLESL